MGEALFRMASPLLERGGKEQEGFADYYRYSRPFDYFHFEFTAVPNASTVSNDTRAR